MLKEHGAARQPFLAHVNKITSVTQLAPFFSRASLATFEATYASTPLDRTLVDETLRAELFAS